MRSDKHQRISIAKDDYHASLTVNYKTFKALHPLGNGFYEIESAPDKVVFDRAMVLGFQILQLAKLLEIKYDFLDRYAIPGSYSNVLCDTDSLIFSINKRRMEDIIREEKRDEYIYYTNGRCGEPTSTEFLLTRSCFTSCEFDDSKTPGVYKFELECDEIVALASKSYVTRDFETDSVKLSSKGCQKHVMMANDPVKMFRNVLVTHQNEELVNSGIRFTWDSNENLHPRENSCIF